MLPQLALGACCFGLLPCQAVLLVLTILCTYQLCYITTGYCCIH